MFKIDSLSELDISELKSRFNEKNYFIHTDEQLEKLTKIINAQGQRLPVILSNRSGKIVAGHARVLAMERLGYKTAKVSFQDFESEAEERQFIIADNEITKQSILDFDKLISDSDFLSDFETSDLDLFGFSDLERALINHLIPNESKDKLSDAEREKQLEKYTKKIEGLPEHEIDSTTDKKLNFSQSDIIDTSLYDKIINEIESEKHHLSELEYTLLRLAATRFLKISFHNAALFYCSRDRSKTFRKLAQYQALVIPDINNTVKYELINLTELTDLITFESTNADNSDV